MRPLITVIVPVYNVEEYLSRCLDSIINQSYQNLQIILVDDGSQDNSGRICDEYKSRDGRIQVIHQSNSGLAGARNAGLAVAKGEYIGFVDSDDRISPDMFETLYEEIKKYDCDISVCGRYLESEDGNITPFFDLNESIVMNSHDAIRKLLVSDHMDAAVWDKLYKINLFDEIEFPKEKYVSEDVPVMYKVLCRAQRIVHCGKPLYYYLLRTGSLSHSKFTDKSMGLYYYYKEVRDKASIRYPDLIEESNFYYFKSLLYLFYLSQEGCPDRKTEKLLRNEIKTNFPAICKNKYLKKGYKIFAFAATIHIEKIAIGVSSRFNLYDSSLNK